jgi:hypothetical protein
MEFTTTNSVETQLDDIIRENILHRFASELQNTSVDNEIRKKDIKDIIALYTANTEEINTKDAQSKLDKLYSSIEENSLKKKWISLTLAQKEDRLKTFMKLLSKDDIYIERILKMLEKGTLKQSYIEYDCHKGEIISLNVPEKVEKPKTVKKKKNV